MKTHWITYLVLTATLAFVANLAFAQQASRAVGQEWNPGLGLIEEDVESLTGQQMLERNQARIATMKANLEGVETVLARVRTEEKDILKINCINESLASIKGFLKVAEQSYVSLVDAVSKSDDAASRHHYALGTMAGTRVSELSDAARVCAGEEVRYAEGTRLDVSIDPDIAPDDEIFLSDEGIVLERLPALSAIF